MKLAEPWWLDNRTVAAVVQQDEEPPRVIWRRRFEIGVIAVLVLLCAVAFVAMTRPFAKPIEFALGEAVSPSAREVAPRPARASVLASFQEEASRVVDNVVRHFDALQSLKDRLAVGGKRAPDLRHVVAGPNQTVLLRRGNLLHALYLLGENGYVIVTGSESRLVRLDDLRAMENDAIAAVTR